MGGQLRPATQAEMLRNHEKSLLKLKNQPSPKQQPGVPMTPSAVAGTGAAVGGPGIVAFTNASGNIDIDGIFTPDYEDYLIYLDMISSPAAITFSAQFRNAAGLYVNATGYRYGLQTMAYAGASSYASPTQGPQLGYVGSSSGPGGGGSVFTVYSPARAAAEIKLAGDGVSSGGRYAFWGWVNGGIGSAVGMRLIPSGSTFTGAMRIYGINPN